MKLPGRSRSLALGVTGPLRLVPRIVWAFTAIHLGTYAYLASLPGLPRADATPIPWGFIALSAAIVYLLARGSPGGWGFAVACDAILIPLFLIPVVNSPGRLKPWGASVLQAAKLAILLSGPMVSHVRRRRFTLRELMVVIALLAVLLAQMAQAQRARQKSIQQFNRQQDQRQRHRGARVRIREGRESAPSHPEGRSTGPSVRDKIAVESECPTLVMEAS